MTDLVDTINPVNNPEQAVQEFVGEQFIEWLRDYIPHEMKTWRVITELERIETSPSKTKKFMLQKFLAHEAFCGTREGDPGLLRFAIANLSESDDPQAEAALEILERRHESELAENDANRKSWHGLLGALGATDEEIARTESKEPTRNYIAELSDLCSNSDWQTALGVIVALDASAVAEYQTLIRLLKKNTLLTDKNLECLSGFSTNKGVVETRHILDKVVFDEADKQLIWEGVHKQLLVRTALLTNLAKYLS